MLYIEEFINWKKKKKKKFDPMRDEETFYEFFMERMDKKDLLLLEVIQEMGYQIFTLQVVVEGILEDGQKDQEAQEKGRQRVKCARQRRCAA